jgi:hypothetical protein
LIEKFFYISLLTIKTPIAFGTVSLTLRLRQIRERFICYLNFIETPSFLQGCGMWIRIDFYGSGSSIFAQSGSGSGSGSKLKQNFRRQVLSAILYFYSAPGSVSGIRIPNTDPDPQSRWIRIRIHNPASFLDE